MHKMTATLMGVILLGLLQAGAQADSVTFSGSDFGGTGTATLTVSIDGNTLTVDLDNNSPLSDDFGGDNAPGITGFGFGASGSGQLESWSFSHDKWIMDTSMAGVSRDFLFVTQRHNIDGALFNPAAASSSTLPGGKKKSVFFTTAMLTMQFDSAPTLDSFFVRMQNVGVDGEGSLKLDGSLITPNGSHAPLPAALWMGLCMLGGMGAVGAGRRRK
jgi:hypothetical protein